MRTPRQLASAVRRRAGWVVRDRVPMRPVTREVQGVTMVLPWSHRLPDYATANPQYGQNLVELARLLGSDEPLRVLDVGANVGDSALQILHATDARVLCVEADPAYLEFLRTNTGRDERVSLVEALLTPAETTAGGTAVRTGGTTRFTEGAGEAMPTLPVDRLRSEHPDFDRLRLVKSDTDGYDTSLVAAIADAWHDVAPVLFFEYDHHLTRLAGHDPLAVWPILEGLGYRDVAVWDNGGDPLGRTTTADIARLAAPLDVSSGPLSSAQTYWDVAVVHADDVAAQTALDALIAPTHQLA